MCHTINTGNNRTTDYEFVICFFVKHITNKIFDRIMIEIRQSIGRGVFAKNTIRDHRGTVPVDNF
jgi:hypothetical protein